MSPYGHNLNLTQPTNYSMSPCIRSQLERFTLTSICITLEGESGTSKYTCVITVITIFRAQLFRMLGRRNQDSSFAKLDIIQVLTIVKTRFYLFFVGLASPTKKHGALILYFVQKSDNTYMNLCDIIIQLSNRWYNIK